MLVSLFGYSLYAQDINYIDESVYIHDIVKKLHKSTGFAVQFVVRDGIPELASENDKALFEKMVSALNNISDGNAGTGQNSQKASPQRSSNDGAPSPGGVDQPEEAAQSQAQSVNSVHDNTGNEIANELRYILFIATTNDPVLLKEVIGSCPRKFNHLKSIANNLGLLNSSAGKTKFAFSESEIIYGVVDFTINRAKEQLVETHLSNWFDKLRKNEFTNQMLPNTLGTLNAFNQDESLSVAQYGDKWKAAFQEDFRNFPLLLQKQSFIDPLLSKSTLSASDQTEIRAVIMGGSHLAYNLYQKKHIVTAINDMSTDYLMDVNTNYSVFNRLVVLSDILLKAGGNLYNNDSYRVVSVDDISRMEYASWKIFIKLLFVRNKSGLDYISNGKIEALFPQLLQNGNIERFSQLYRQTINLIATYQSSINSGENITTSELSFEGTRKIFELSFQLVEQVTAYLPYITENEGYDHKKSLAFVAKAKPYYTAIAQIGEGISNRRYGSLLDGTVTIIRLLDVDEQDMELIYYLQRYGSFMVNIINAKDAEQVKMALDELIPKNLYKLKNTHEFTVSISSYPGIFCGFERISKYRQSDDGTVQTGRPKEGSWGFAPAVYLPIGFDLNWGNKKEKNDKNPGRYNSFNLFFQAVDLGAVLNYRLSGTDSGEESDPQISFRQLLSPGLALMKHFSNSPLVIGAQMGYTPALRAINQNGNEYKSHALRFGIFMAVDVTYFNVFTSKKKAK